MPCVGDMLMLAGFQGGLGQNISHFYSQCLKVTWPRIKNFLINDGHEGESSPHLLRTCYLLVTLCQVCHMCKPCGSQRNPSQFGVTVSLSSGWQSWDSERLSYSRSSSLGQANPNFDSRAHSLNYDTQTVFYLLDLKILCPLLLEPDMILYMFLDQSFCWGGHKHEINYELIQGYLWCV